MVQHKLTWLSSPISFTIICTDPSSSLYGAECSNIITVLIRYHDVLDLNKLKAPATTMAEVDRANLTSSISGWALLRIPPLELHQRRRTDLILHHISKMSFSDLKASRQSKQSRSFVRPKPDRGDENASTEPEQERTDVDTSVFSNGKKPQTQLVDAASYPFLPETLEIRQSSDSGRGIYAKEAFKPGMCPITFDITIS